MLKPGASRSPRRGNALVLTLGVMTLLAGLAAAQFSVMQSNLRQSRFYLDRTVLHKYAETGIALAIHDVRHAISASPGNIGTETWDVSLDYGRDGVQGTQDDGEGDGVPTPGEPAVFAQPIGPPRMNILFVTAVLDSGFANVQRIVATVVSDEGLVRVEKYLQSQVVQIPRSGAVYVSPGVLLNFQGSRFRVDGRDHDVFGNRVPGPQQYGLSTAVAGNPGDNAAALLAQIPAPFQDQIKGRGGDPSIGEDAGGDVDIDALVDQFRANNTNELIPGTYTDLVSGNIFAGDIPVTFSGGDLVLAGNGGGAGVLVVDGNLTITGRFTFHGLIIVRGDVMLTGGGTRIGVIGATIIGQSLNALDEADLSVLGEAELLYSSRVLDAVQSVLDTRPTYEGVYYDEN